MMKNRVPMLRALLSLGLCWSAALAAAQGGPGADGSDPRVRPQDDLFRAANGGWLDKTEIPADKSAYGSGTLLRDLADERVRKIVDDLAGQPQKAGSDAAKVAAFYRAYTDEAGIDRVGLAPLKATLAGIDAIRTPRELSAWLGRHQGAYDLPVNLDAYGDAKNPAVYAAYTLQGGLGLPDRDYYLQDEARLLKARKAYEDYLTRLGTLAGDKRAADSTAKALVLELALAQAHWPRTELRDPVKVYNPMSVAELAAKAPGMDWPAFLAGARLAGAERLIVGQPSEVAGVARLVAKLPLDRWKAYLRLRVLDNSAGVLPQPFREASFAFRGTALTGTTAELPRWQKGVQQVNQVLGEAVGRVYVERHFPPAYKARMLELVGNLMASYRESIDGLGWMSPETKTQARAKLAKYVTKIAYPDVWRDYSKLEVRAGDAAGNRARAGRFGWERVAVRVGQPVNRQDWGMSPQTVNAYYEPLLNEIVFPAAILQPPFFDMAADDALNYGAIGAIIGHEISHGFDDEGSQFDGDGKLNNWWTESDRKAFEAIADKLVAQYDAYEPIPGKHVNGRLTLGENIADLSGLQIAFKAWKRSLGGKPAPVIDGLSGEQRFFYGWARAWRSKLRDERLLVMLTTDPHSPPTYRALGAIVNHDGFHEAFGTKPGDGMFKASEERIRIW